MLSWLFALVKMNSAGLCRSLCWQNGGLAVVGQYALGKIEAWLMLAIVLPSIRADRLEGLGACYCATWQDGGLAVVGKCALGKIEDGRMLAIVRADRLEHATLLPGKMAALLLLANVTVYFIFISVEQTIV
jgi:hypothetical protein